ncbi:MAG TPA: hypothetical protein DD473_24240 [Planctomycetaceae bacterium]|nr:hypothetical protein [Planctomycetaceae bacterium]
MLFSSLVFLCLFLPLVLAVYYLTGKDQRNQFLLIASLAFYAWGEGRLVVLLLLSLIFNYVLAARIGKLICDRTQKSASRAKILVAFAVVANLIPLAYYKYSGFLLGDSLDPILGAGWFDVALPLGISFYTFQAMSYVIDVYRRDASPAKSFTHFACYVSCFPQLVAGPIVRYKDVSRQLIERVTSIDKFHEGIKRFVVGLAKKVLIANTLAVYADVAFGLPVEDLSIEHAWIGAICYALQIYFDFSGYSDMAIGLGLMLGFRFAENFNYPYIAVSIQDFWSRWHISLSTWFRDYLYIPLGGNRNGKLRTIVNLWIVFLLCGLWHGASWNFILWGAYYGAFLSLERIIHKDLTAKVPNIVRRCYVLLVVLVGWVLFRATTLEQTAGYLAAMAGQGAGMLWSYPFKTDLLLAIFFGIVFSMPVQQSLARIPPRIRVGFEPLYIMMLMGTSMLLLVNGTHNPFLYFRF